MRQAVYFESVFSSQRFIQLCRTDQYTHTVIVSDETVASLYIERLQFHLQKHGIVTNSLTIPAGESSKSRDMKAHLEDRMLALECGPDSCMIALGGGVVTDLAGFVAATYCRGIPIIYLPTTLLAMVDAALGGKTGINTAYGKNLIGVLSDPRAVWIDVNWLTSLPDFEYRTAFSEVIKHALITSIENFEDIRAQTDALKRRDPTTLLAVIKKSCEIKLKICQNSNRDVLNLGHTIAHALEKASHYTISHGQAVAAGLIAESYLSCQLGMLAHRDFKSIQSLIKQYEIPLPSMLALSKEDLDQALTFDKKSRYKKPRFVLLKTIGEVFYANDGTCAIEVDEAILNQTLDEMFHQMV